MKNKIKKNTHSQLFKNKIESIVNQAMSQWNKKGPTLKDRNINIKEEKEIVFEKIRD